MMSQISLQERTEVKTQISAAELLTEFNRYANKVKILSLDCFDTLLWRKVATPRDVFYDLAHRPAFKALDYNALMRINSETLAYKLNRVKNGYKQATLTDIYLAGFPKLTEDQVNALMADELAAEIETCYAFSPVIELIRAAHAKGIKIIIVSDTYLNQTQLRQLLAANLPDDVMKCIHKIYCSCEYHLGKVDGLFKHVVTDLQVAPQTMLHIGDNYKADFAAPKQLNLHALHFVHHAEIMTELLRMQAATAGFIDPSIRTQRSLSSPHHAVIAAGLHAEKPESVIGYASVGPIMYAFARFLCDEVAQLKKAGKNPKVLFLMRDAYLPYLACEAYAGKPIGTCVRISRFTSYASSFRSVEDIDRYLANSVQSLRFENICAQLLLPDAVTATIIKKVQASGSPVQTFLAEIHSDRISKIIFEQSKAYRQRFFRYLEKEVGLQQNDTLVFVDLGYTGTAQIKLEPVFKDEWNIDIVGRYLAALRTPNWQATRKGLFDPSVYDDKALVMFVTYIGVFEQISTSCETSVVDFDDDGNAILSDASVSENQHQMLKAIQSESLRFIHEAKQFDGHIEPSIAMLRDAAAISLCRFIYLPTKSELDYLTSFQFDFNLGTKELIPLFDREKGLMSLRRRSWLHCVKENLENMRTNYPAEWRAANLELAITLMAQHRYEFEFTVNDLSQRQEQVEVVIIQDKQATSFTGDATLTHDGFYALLIPVAQGNVQVGIRFGAIYQWVEIESAELINMATLYTQSESQHTLDASSAIMLDQMQNKGGGLFEALSEEGILIFVTQDKFDSNYVLRIVFRPIVKRDSDS